MHEPLSNTHRAVEEPLSRRQILLPFLLLDGREARDLNVLVGGIERKAAITKNAKCLAFEELCKSEGKQKDDDHHT